MHAGHMGLQPLYMMGKNLQEVATNYLEGHWVRIIQVNNVLFYFLQEAE